MKNIGTLWKCGIEEGRVEKALEVAESEKAAKRLADEKCLEKLQSIITDACAKKAPSVKVTSAMNRSLAEEKSNRNVRRGWLEREDIAKSYRQAGRCPFMEPKGLSGKGALSPDYFAGQARLIAEWCEVNGLECFITTYVVSDPNDNDEYDLNARPKS